MHRNGAIILDHRLKCSTFKSIYRNKIYEHKQFDANFKLFASISFSQIIHFECELLGWWRSNVRCASPFWVSSWFRLQLYTRRKSRRQLIRSNQHFRLFHPAVQKSPRTRNKRTQSDATQKQGYFRTTMTYNRKWIKSKFLSLQLLGWLNIDFWSLIWLAQQVIFAHL